MGCPEFSIRGPDSERPGGMRINGKSTADRAWAAKNVMYSLPANQYSDRLGNSRLQVSFLQQGNGLVKNRRQDTQNCDRHYQHIHFKHLGSIDD